jgi:hypothetical protein
LASVPVSVTVEFAEAYEGDIDVMEMLYPVELEAVVVARA